MARPKGWRRQNKRHSTAAKKGWRNRMSRRRGSIVVIGGSNLKIDRQLSAKKPGKRRSRHGKTYYEYRRNRSDKSRKTRL